jgi:ABC-type Mn2+/Zn2+ transport system permease subunit
VIAGACVFGVLASVVMGWASNRSALWNMVFGGVLALAVLAGAVIIAFLLTRAAFPN